MRAKIVTGALVAALVAAAFFLPELLLAWGDSQSLDSLHMETQDEAREGFAESIQLTVPEKIMLLRSGKLTAMELDRVVVGGGSAGEAAVHLDPGGVPPDLRTPEELERYAEETGRMWETRLTSVRGEIRSLQTLGGLPEIWRTEGPSDYTGYGDLLYLDPNTYMSFQVYHFSLSWETYSLDLLVDAQSGRILTFTLQWVQSGQPNWGPRGASGFGSAWRDYWRMDSVSTGWYNEYTRNVLENAGTLAYNSGDYAAHDQITFMYDGQSMSVPLDCQGSRSGNFAINWNR